MASLFEPVTRISTREVDPIVVTPAMAYINDAYSLLKLHIILTAIGLALTALLPIHSRWTRRIDTSVRVEGNAEMEAIELSGD